MNYNSTIQLKHFTYKGKFCNEDILYCYREGNKMSITSTIRFPLVHRSFIFITFKENNLIKANKKRLSHQINHLLRGL